MKNYFAFDRNVAGDCGVLPYEPPVPHPETLKRYYLASEADKRIAELTNEVDILNTALEHNLERTDKLEKALVDMVTSHNGYSIGAGPCICAAHESARKLLGMTRDDVHPLRGL